MKKLYILLIYLCVSSTYVCMCVCVHMNVVLINVEARSQAVVPWEAVHLTCLR